MSVSFLAANLPAECWPPTAGAILLAGKNARQFIGLALLISPPESDLFQRARSLSKSISYARRRNTMS
jgi:hypothetical protein